jgi:hypothetical protein
VVDVVHTKDIRVTEFVVGISEPPLLCRGPLRAVMTPVGYVSKLVIPESDIAEREYLEQEFWRDLRDGCNHVSAPPQISSFILEVFDPKSDLSNLSIEIVLSSLVIRHV